MREIKFRAWDLLDKKMILPSGDMDILANGSQIEWDWDYDSPRQSRAVDEQAILMQYTGLKDCKGKEIYEGDLVKDAQGIGEVGFATPSFVVRTQDKNYWCLGAGLCYPDNYQLKETEVIGDIYTNPELMTSLSIKGEK